MLNNMLFVPTDLPIRIQWETALAFLVNDSGGAGDTQRILHTITNFNESSFLLISAVARIGDDFEAKALSGTKLAISYSLGCSLMEIPELMMTYKVLYPLRLEASFQHFYVGDGDFYLK